MTQGYSVIEGIPGAHNSQPVPKGVTDAEGYNKALEIIALAEKYGIELTQEQINMLASAIEFLGIAGFFVHMGDTQHTVLAESLLIELAGQLFATLSGMTDQMDPADAAIVSAYGGSHSSYVEGSDAAVTAFVNDLNLEDQEQVEALIKYLVATGIFTEEDIKEIERLNQLKGSGDISDQVLRAEMTKIIVDAMHRANEQSISEGREPMFSEAFILDFIYSSTVQNSLGAVMVFRDSLMDPSVATDDTRYQTEMTQFQLVQQIRGWVQQAFGIAGNA